MNAVTPPSFPGSPLTSEHAWQLAGLLAGLSAEEAWWVSGYLAHFAGQAAAAPAVPEVGYGGELLILFGSETGHTEGLALRAEDLARAADLAVRCVDMADYRAQDLREVRWLLALTSTHGEGDPPAAAVDFCEFLLGRKAPRLQQLGFAVLGLGDSSYARFCQTAKDIDRRLEELGARRLLPPATLDTDFEQPAEAWLAEAIAAFGREIGPASVPVSAVVVPAPTPPVASVAAYGEKNPFAARLLDSVNLNGRGSEKETRHVELSLAGSGLKWSAGDSLGVWPENDPALVAALIAALGLEPDAPIGDDDARPLAEALRRRLEITALTPGFIRRYAAAAAAKPLRALARPGQEAAMRAYMVGRQVIDVIGEYPAKGLSGRDFAAMLRPLAPRLYSLASSPAAFPDEAHLTVAVVRYESHGRRRVGVASGFLAERCQIDATVPVFVSPNKKFRLPRDPATPIIMVGPGTGVAPFRAFMQERVAMGAKGRSWLFFGDRHFRTDFLYQAEWLRLLKDGRLTRMDVAFSRDQPEKRYVQHCLVEHGREVFAWLQEGACLYVCGDAARMAPDVHAALAGIVASETGQGHERAEEYLRQLQREKRYLKDVY